jgi:electron transfer flavoprotein beta subunit
LIICGQQTIDGDTAQVGPGIACRLGMSQLTLVEEIAGIDHRTRVIRVRRRLEQHHEIVEAGLPALITVVREINVPRYPTVPGRLAAADAPLPTWSNSVLKMEAEKIGLRGSHAGQRISPRSGQSETVNSEGENRNRLTRSRSSWTGCRALHDQR